MNSTPESSNSDLRSARHLGDVPSPNSDLPSSNGTDVPFDHWLPVRGPRRHNPWRAHDILRTHHLQPA